MAFKLRSGNTTNFKSMGSSPAKDKPVLTHDHGLTPDSPAKQKVDPDAPGTPGTPGYEPPVKRSDLDDAGKAIWDAHRAKAKEKIEKSPEKKQNGPKAEVKPEKLRKVPMTNKEMSKDESIRTRMSEGSIESQALRRKENKKQATSKAKMKRVDELMKSPAKQRSTKGGEGQDQNKIFDAKGNHVGSYVNGKKVMKSTSSAHGQLEDAKKDFKMDKRLTDEKNSYNKPMKKKSPAKDKRADGENNQANYHNSDWKDAEAHQRRKHSPAKATTTAAEKRANLLKAVPNKAAYDKLSDIDKKGFDIVGGKAGLPRKKSPAKQAKTSGFGPSTAFGGVKNPELVKDKKKPFTKKVMKDGKKTQVIHKGKELKGDWQANEQLWHPVGKKSPAKMCGCGHKGGKCNCK